ncbi:MAG TPA: FHA domain-containing protein [Thermoanaerobaculia bacterium]|nr:FHA domain-containing protein [Thermoanaerobaculia bacterium]
MQVVLQGSLRHFPAADLLTFLCSRGQSGTLELQNGERRARILYQDDKILHADAPGARDAMEAVLEVFHWIDGIFALADAAVVPDNVAPAVLDLTSILEEARRRAEAASSFPDGTFFRVVDDPALQQQVSLTADEFRLLFRVGGGRSFRDLFSDLGIPAAELASRLRGLQKLGLLTIIEETPPPPDITAPHRKTISRKKTLVGSLTPDGALDSVYPLLDSEYTIGRTPDNTIALADGSVSSKHARVLRTSEGFVIEDLQSRNGTFVNGERVTEKRLLADGDLLRLGKVILTFNIAREPKAGEQTQPEVRVG